MALVKVPVLGTAGGKAVRINTAANEGATIGTDLKGPDGSVLTIEELSALLAINSTVINTTASTGVETHGLLLGLDADDHLQYLNRSGVRNMTGDLTFENDLAINWLNPADASIELIAFGPQTAGAPPATDPDIDSVVLLISAETAVAGTEQFVSDIGNHTFDWVLTSGVQPTTVDGEVSTAQAKFGTRSIYAKESTGANNAGWSAPSSTDFDFGSNSITLETHIYIDNMTSVVPVLTRWDFGQRAFSWQIETDGRISFSVSSNGTSITSIFSQVGSVSQITTGSWYHIAITRDGDTWRAWLDGAQIGSDVVNAVTLFTSTAPLDLLQQSGAGTIEVYVDNVRITDGVARYTTAFTAPTGPFDGSSFDQGFTLGDAVYNTILEGLTVNITAAETDIDGTLSVDGATTLIGGLTSQGVSDFNGDVNINGGDTFTIFDSTDLLSAAFAYIFTDFTTTFVSTDDWDIIGLTGNVRLRDGAGLQINDSADLRDATFSHDGADLNVVNNNTTNFNIASLLGNFWIRDGAGLRISDSTDVDSATFDHDGTDFNTVFVTTTDWNISGITSIQAGSVNADFAAVTATSYDGILAANLLDKTAAETISGAYEFTGNGSGFAAIHINNVNPKIRFTETDAAAENGEWYVEANGEEFHIVAVDDALGAPVNAIAITRTGTAADSVIVSADIIVEKGTTGPTLLRIGTDVVDGDRNGLLRMFGQNAGTQYGFQIVASSTNVGFQGTGTNPATSIQQSLNHDILSGNYLRIRDSLNTSYVQFSANADTLSLVPISIDRVTLSDGLDLRFLDSTNSDTATFDHDGANFNTVFTNTADWEISGLAGGLVVLSDDAVPLHLNGTLNSSYTLLIDNDSNGTANAARVSISSGDANIALFVSGSGRTSALVTSGPTGAQLALRALGNYPLVFGTSNTERFRITGAGEVGVRHGNEFRIYASTEADYMALSHDGTDFDFTFVNTTEVNWSGAVLQMADEVIARAELLDYGITDQGTLTISTNAATFNLTSGNSAAIDLQSATGTVTLTVSNPPASGTYGEMTLTIIQGSTARAITWPASFRWPAGAAPTLSSANDSVDVVTAFTRDGGTNWYATIAQDFS